MEMKYTVTCSVVFTVYADNEQEAEKEAEREYKNYNCWPDFIDVECEDEE